MAMLLCLCCSSAWQWERGEVPAGSRWQSSFITLLAARFLQTLRGIEGLHSQTHGKTIATRKLCDNRRWQSCHSDGSHWVERERHGKNGVSEGWNGNKGWRSDRRAECVNDRDYRGWNTWDIGDSSRRLVSYRWWSGEGWVDIYVCPCLGPLYPPA